MTAKVYDFIDYRVRKLSAPKFKAATEPDAVQKPNILQEPKKRSTLRAVLALVKGDAE